MPRIGGQELPRKKRVVVALTYIFGIGSSKSKKILGKLEINENTKISDLRDDQVNLIQNELRLHPTGGDVRREIGYNIKRLKEIGSYRGIRHRKGLPVRGQTTKKNARTRKGPRKTVANKKKVDNKT
nr:30S ribosomal protein S13-like [Lytechinus pictus]